MINRSRRGKQATIANQKSGNAPGCDVQARFNPADAKK
jgi:hypothetical protein